MIIIAFGHLF